MVFGSIVIPGKKAHRRVVCYFSVDSYVIFNCQSFVAGFSCSSFNKSTEIYILSTPEPI